MKAPRLVFRIASALTLVACACRGQAQGTAENADVADAELASLHNIDANWMPSHVNHSATIASLGHADVIFLGDSLTEGWLERHQTNYFPGFAGALQVFEEMGVQLGVQLLNFGYSGDRVENTLWRIQNGELPENTTVRVVVLCIGVNNMMHENETVDAVAQKVMSLAQHITTMHPETELLLLGLMPESYKTHDPSPNPETAAVNDLILTSAPRLLGPQVTFLDCSPFFLNGEGLRIPEYYLHGQVHFNAQGYQAWARCIGPVLRSLLQGSTWAASTAYLGTVSNSRWVIAVCLVFGLTVVMVLAYLVKMRRKRRLFWGGGEAAEEKLQMLQLTREEKVAHGIHSSEPSNA